MPKFKDLTGQKINNWKIIKFIEINKFGASTWLCECECEKHTKKVLSQQSIKKQLDCGCSKQKNLIGKVFGKWTVLSKIDNPKHLKYPRKSWLCKCECGNIRNVTETNLINNLSTSCGCTHKYNEYKFIGNYTVGILSNNCEFYIDNEDYDLIKDDYWVLSSDKYVVSSSGRFAKKRLHRIVMHYNGNKPIDHINRVRLDCRKSNLRIASDQENAFNQSKRYDNKSGIIGVYWWERDNNWLAQIKYNYKRYFLGYYDGFEDAVLARLRAELKYFGAEFAPQRHLFKQYGIGGDDIE